MFRNRLILILIFGLSAFEHVSAGCRQKTLCCVERNVTCYAHEGDEPEERMYAEARGVEESYIVVDQLFKGRYGAMYKASKNFAEVDKPIWETDDDLEGSGQSSEEYNERAKILERKRRQLKSEEKAARCFCDADCMRLGDCCSDFKAYCEPSACALTQWTEWSSCDRLNSSSDSIECGLGRQLRERSIIREPFMGGEECAHLEEYKACMDDCGKSELQDVALILPHSYDSARNPAKYPHIYSNYDINKPKFDNATRPVFSYSIHWIHRLCKDKELKSKLAINSTVTVECLQMTPDMQCNGIGVVNSRSYWKVAVGERFCLGIWIRKELPEEEEGTKPDFLFA